MELHSFREFNRNFSWQSRMFFLLAVLVLTLGSLTDAWQSGWSLAMLVGLAILLLVESIALRWVRSPKLRQGFRLMLWGILLLLLALVLIGALIRS